MKNILALAFLGMVAVGCGPDQEKAGHGGQEATPQNAADSQPTARTVADFKSFVVNPDRSVDVNVRVLRPAPENFIIRIIWIDASGDQLKTLGADTQVADLKTTGIRRLHYEFAPTRLTGNQKAPAYARIEVMGGGGSGTLLTVELAKPHTYAK